MTSDVDQIDVKPDVKPDVDADETVRYEDDDDNYNNNNMTDAATSPFYPDARSPSDLPPSPEWSEERRRFEWRRNPSTNRLRRIGRLREDV